MVYVETLAGDIYLEERSDVNRYTLAFDRLRAASLHPDDSVQMIERRQDGTCVEVAGNLPGLVAVRDSIQPAGDQLVVRTSLASLPQGGMHVSSADETLREIA